jgi:5-methylthioadenosine/S-adenosylhomocysteine deaminase
MTEIDLLVVHGLVVTMDDKQPVIEDGALAINQGKILAVGSSADLSTHYTARKTIDAHRKAVLPGFVDTHHHFLQNFHKGTRDDLDLIDWIDSVSVPRIRVAVQDYLAGTYDIQLHASRLGCVDAIKSGITTILNMEWATHPSVVDVFEQAGIRVVHTITMTDQWISPEVLLPHDRLLSLADELRERCQSSANGRVSFRYGLACPNSCSIELIKEVRALADHHQVPIHIHIAESEYEWHNIHNLFGATPTGHLYNLGLLGPDVLGAHCIWLSDDDIQLFVKTGTKVAHNPKCNMKIADGIAPITKMLEAGIVVSLGTDSCAVNDNMDMFEAMRTAAFLQKVTTMDPTVLPAPVTLRMGTLGGAKALGMEKHIGSLEVGKKADLIIVSLSGSHMRPINKIENSLVYCANARDVESVICDGQLVMENHRILTLDEEAWVAGAVEYAYQRFTQAGIELPRYYCLPRAGARGPL